MVEMSVVLDAHDGGKVQSPSVGLRIALRLPESLNLVVTSLFLHQAVDVTGGQDVQLWLMRLKQLDLRLVQSVSQGSQSLIKSDRISTDGRFSCRNAGARHAPSTPMETWIPT